MNELLWFGFLLVNFLGIIASYRLWGRPGLFVWIAIATITANIQVTKTVELFGLTATLGNIVYAGSFLATDILNEVYGPVEARRGVIFGFFAIIVFTLFMNVATFFVPAPDDFAHEHLVAIFSLLPRISVASLTAYALSQYHDVWAFQLWKRLAPRSPWLRNNLSTLVSQLIDTVVFTSAAFVGVFPTPVLLEIVVTTYLFKGVVAILDTPFFYLAKFLRAPDRSEAV